MTTPATAPPVEAPEEPPEEPDDEEGDDEPHLVHVLHVHDAQSLGQQPAHEPVPHANPE